MMPPASRGLRIFSLHAVYRPTCRRYYSSAAPPKPPVVPRTKPAQIPRAKDTRLQPAKAPIEPEAEFEAPKEPLTRRGRFKARLERFIYPNFLRKRPGVRTFIFVFFTVTPIVGFVLLHVPFEVRRVTGPSMQPTINPDCDGDHAEDYSPSWVLVQKWNINYRKLVRRKQMQEGKVTVVTGDYERGDIVVYATPHDPHKIAIKRIVGVAGDVVTPLDGYPGGDEPVVVPFNHIWVEGDVGNRKKSVDSNYFGPIATGLIRGKVLILWSPWWRIYAPKLLRSDTDDWPARKQARVKEDAVHDASIDPDRIEKFSAFTGERGAKTLQLLRTRSSEMEEEFLVNEHRRAQVWQFWQRALVAARKHHDPEARQCARDIADELERLHGKKALKEASVLHKMGKRQQGQKVSEQALESEIDLHFENAKAYEDVRAQERKALENPAWAAMEEMKKQSKAYGEMYDREIEESRQSQRH